MTSADGLDRHEPEAERRRRGRTIGHTRRLSDKLLVAFRQACDQADFEVAERLLHVLEMMLRRRPTRLGERRGRNMDALVAAHERLWQLRHPDQFWQQ